MTSFDTKNNIQLGFISHKWAENHQLLSRYEASMKSTNDLAKSEAFAPQLMNEPVCVYFTEHQTRGRGRNQNTWIDSSNGGSFLSSWSYLVEASPQPTTSCLVGLALFKACLATWPFLPWSLKAPNDIYLNNQKVGGILLETIQQGQHSRLVIGIGLNVFEHPSDLIQATSILNSLTAKTPLLGQDWICFLDRIFFELTEVSSRCDSPLNTSDRATLLMALNLNPCLLDKYVEVESSGNLILPQKTINWSEL